MRSLSSLAQAVGLLGWVLAASAAGAVGALANTETARFYAELSRPAWAPPGWLFGPVWSLLYLLMGSAAWLVWRRWGWAGAAPALLLFVAQLLPNAMWTWIFFVWKQGAWALADITLLWLLVAGTGLAFWRLHRLAAVLLLPYLAWVSFAGALTLSLWQRNAALLG